MWPFEKGNCQHIAFLKLVCYTQTAPNGAATLTVGAEGPAPTKMALWAILYQSENRYISFLIEHGFLTAKTPRCLGALGVLAVY